MKATTLYDKLFRDSEGKTAVFQFPNLPLTVWALGTLAANQFDGTAAHRASLVALVAILFWSFDEITHGTSLFRRILGAVVLLASLLGRI